MSSFVSYRVFTQWKTRKNNKYFARMVKNDEKNKKSLWLAGFFSF